MRVAMYYNNRDIRLQELPVPKIGPGELLVRIQASGVCGTDVMEWYRVHKAPLVLGHEIAGEVVEVGEGLKNFKVGDRIVATHHVPCGTCHYCLSGHETVCDTLLSGTHFDPGGFCEYTRLPAINVDRGTWVLPEDVTYEDATFVEPLGCVLRGQRTAKLKPAQRVLVLGSGISGLLHINLARALGAGKIVATDINEFRLEAALRFGADTVFHAEEDVPEKYRSVNGGFGADLVIVCAMAAGAFQQAIQAVERGGTILAFAATREGVTIPISINDLFWRRDVTITTSYAAAPFDLVTALKLIHQKRVNVSDMITHRLSLADTLEGFRLVVSGGDSIKVIINTQI